MRTRRGPGRGALTVTSRPSRETQVRGAVNAAPLSDGVSPLGFVANVGFTIFGQTTRVAVAVAPLESVAVRRTSTELFVAAARSSGGGPAKLDALPANWPAYGCVCVSRRRTTLHVSAPTGTRI